MNAQKEVEYIAEIVRLKSELKKAECIIKSEKWVSASDMKKYVTVDNINEMIGAHFVANPDCTYVFTPSKVTVLDDGTKKIKCLSSPSLSATIVIDLK